MIERFLGLPPVGDDAEIFCAAREDVLAGEAARALALGPTGVVLSETDFVRVAAQLAIVAERYGASPEVMQAVLYDLEPALAQAPLLDGQ
jgi:hypothetical protein